MIVLLNGSFGIGKTTVARALVSRTPKSALFDPELVGAVLQRPLRVIARRSPGARDFQNLRLWRSLTVRGVRCWHLLYEIVFVPMTFSEPAILAEVRDGLEVAGLSVEHYCLTAPLETIEARLRGRRVVVGAPEGDWVHRRARECVAAHSAAEFAAHVPTQGRSVEEVVADIEARLHRGAAPRNRPARR